MNRRVLRFAAIAGAAALSTLAIAPAFAATGTSQATAHSLTLSIAGNTFVAQDTEATNDGTSQTAVDKSTVPNLATIIGGNNAIALGVAPQAAVAKPDGTSYACAGIAGTGGGIATVGNSSCNIKGSPLTLNLATLNLDLTHLLGPGALTGPLSNLLGGLGLGQALDGVVGQLVSAVNGTPLGDLSVGGSLAAIEATCNATPDGATGDSTIARAGGSGDTVPIGITLPGGTDVPLVNLPVNPPVNFKPVVQAVDLVELLTGPGGSLSTELNTALGGGLSQLDAATQALLTPLKQQILNKILDALAPVLQAVQDNLLDITMNHQVVSDGGKKITVTALELDVLPAAKQFTGASLVSGEIGKVSCGPNTRIVAPPATPTPTDNTHPPTVVDSGVAGKADHTARDVLTATAALMLLAGTAGLIGYRRMLTK